jgi:hypothetical protein
MPLYGPRLSRSCRNTSVAVMVLANSQARWAPMDNHFPLGRTRKRSHPRRLRTLMEMRRRCAALVANSPLRFWAVPTMRAWNRVGVPPLRELSGWSGHCTVRLPVVGRAPFTWITTQLALPTNARFSKPMGLSEAQLPIPTSEIVVSCQTQQCRPQSPVETRLSAAYGYTLRAVSLT